MYQSFLFIYKKSRTRKLYLFYLFKFYFLIQWGAGNGRWNNGWTASAQFPIAFANVFSVVDGMHGTDDGECTITGYSNTAVSFMMGDMVTPHKVMYIAVGN